MSKKLVIKTIARTLVYQALLVWAGFSVGFMMNPEYWGNRAPLVQRSIKNIFYPVEYNQEVKDFLISIGRSRIYFSLEPGCSNLKILSDKMASDEQYIAKFEYTDPKGKRILVEDYNTKINWKSWEYDFPSPDEEIANSYEDF